MLQFESEEKLISFVISSKLPEWLKKMFLRNAEAVQVHSQGQLFYKIDRLFPNEDPASKQHRVLSFESITEPSFGRAANNVNRIFKNSSYTVEASDKTLALATAQTFGGENFYNWFLDEWTKWALKEDPNSRFVVYPPEYIQKTNRPMIVFVSTEFIKYIDEETFIFISEGESQMKYDLEESRIKAEVYYDDSIDRVNVRHAQENTFTPKIVATVVRPVYHCFFKGDGFYRIEQMAANGKEYEITYTPIVQDFLPVDVAGGEKGKQEVYKSFLHPFVQFGNLALLQHSQHTAVNFTFSFPRMSEIETPCDAPNCHNGMVECDVSDKWPNGEKPCSKCRGTGFRANQTPYKVYKKQFDPNATDWEVSAKQLEVPVVQYYTPDTAILDYSKSEWKDYLEMAETAVYIQQRVKTGNTEAAKSKEIDREDLYSFLARVGKTFFSKLRFALQCIENYNVGKPTRVNVNQPYSYAILSEGEAFAALQNILTSNVPVMPQSFPSGKLYKQIHFPIFPASQILRCTEGHRPPFILFPQ
jgi:hypothetical protein